MKELSRNDYLGLMKAFDNKKVMTIASTCGDCNEIVLSVYLKREIEYRHHTMMLDTQFVVVSCVCSENECAKYESSSLFEAIKDYGATFKGYFIDEKDITNFCFKWQK